MSITFRSYNPEPRFGEDYYKLRDFLIRLDSHNYHFGRWDWMITSGWLDKNDLSRIGLWEDSGELVALSTYDTRLDGKCFFPYIKGYEHLSSEMIRHAQENLAKDGIVKLLICDGDMNFQEAATNRGFIPTQNKDCDAIYPIDVSKITYSLPDGLKLQAWRILLIYINTVRCCGKASTMR